VEIFEASYRWNLLISLWKQYRSKWVLKLMGLTDTRPYTICQNRKDAWAVLSGDVREVGVTVCYGQSSEI
jgi:hypothetical protein